MDEHTGARVCVLLATLVNEVRGLRADLADRKAMPRTVSTEDEAALAYMLPLLHDMTDGESFTVHQIISDDDVRGALNRCGIGENSRKFGRLLRRAADADYQIDGLYIDAGERKRDGIVFCVTTESRESRLASKVSQRMRDNLSHD